MEEGVIKKVERNGKNRPTFTTTHETSAVAKTSAVPQAA
jgi:hypothetical protein